MDAAGRRLALIEVVERDGHPSRMHDVHAWPLTLGRALDNDLVVDDPHVAAHHARIDADEHGVLRLTVLDSLNGLGLEGRRIVAGQTQPLPPGGASVVLGATRMRVRLPDEALAPERPLASLTPGRRAAPLLAAVGLLVLTVSEHWLSLDPGADYSAWVPLLAGVPLALAGWCAIWALLSKLFQHRFDFVGHLRIALPWMLGIGAVEALLPPVAAALDLPLLWRLSGPLQALLLALWVHDHLRHLLPLHPRAVAGAVAVTALVAGSLSVALTYRATDNFSGAPYMSTLPLPGLQLARPVPIDTLVQSMAPLAQGLAQRVKRSREDDEDSGADGSGD